jgi:hypothetical protein
MENKKKIILISTAIVLAIGGFVVAIWWTKIVS